MLLQPLVFLLQPPKPASVVPLAPASRGRLRCGGGLTTPYYSHRWPGRSASSTSGLLAPAAQTSISRASCSCLPWPAAMRRRPHHPLLLPPLARPSLYSPTPPVILRRRQPHTTAEPVNPHTPLRMGVHCPGALGVAWSAWSTTDIHLKWTVHGEADSWVHGRTQGNAALLRAK